MSGIQNNDQAVDLGCPCYTRCINSFQTLKMSKIEGMIKAHIHPKTGLALGLYSTGLRWGLCWVDWHLRWVDWHSHWVCGAF